MGEFKYLFIILGGYVYIELFAMRVLFIYF